MSKRDIRHLILPTWHKSEEAFAPTRPKLFQTAHRLVIPRNPAAGVIDPLTGITSLVRNRTADGRELAVSNPGVTSGGGSLPTVYGWQDGGIRDQPSNQAAGLQNLGGLLPVGVGDGLPKIGGPSNMKLVPHGGGNCPYLGCGDSKMTGSASFGQVGQRVPPGVTPPPGGGGGGNGGGDGSGGGGFDPPHPISTGDL